MNVAIYNGPLSDIPFPLARNAWWKWKVVMIRNIYTDSILYTEPYKYIRWTLHCQISRRLGMCKVYKDGKYADTRAKICATNANTAWIICVSLSHSLTLPQLTSFFSIWSRIGFKFRMIFLCRVRKSHWSVNTP